LRNLDSTLDAVAPVVVVQPDERHANRTASVLEWYDRHRYTTSGANEEER